MQNRHLLPFICLGLFGLTLAHNAVRLVADEDEPSVFSGQGCTEDELYRTQFEPELRQIQGDVQRIIRHVMSPTHRGRTWQQLADFVDKFGPRFTGTKNLEDSIDYMIKLLNQERHDNVHGEQVKVPKWTRGTEYATIIRPLHKKMNILGLGYSVGTNGHIVRAPVLVVNDFDDLARKGSLAKGKIVVFNFKFESYGKSVQYRSRGASMASRYGAVAAMIRSVTPFSINSPHTGMQQYQSNITRIPAISITTEDADLLQRISDRNEEIEIQFYSENYLHSDSAISRNTVSEIKGSSRPDEVVIVSGHLDSWDVGQGAMDDGAGAFISWRALSVVRELGLKPKRTMRSILWTGEEMGLIGAAAYRKAHHNQMDEIVIAMESDIGTFTPRGITYSGGNKTSQCVMYHIMQMMSPLNASQLILANEGSDVTVFTDAGVPISSLDTENDKYFYFHHTDGDMMTVENKDDLDKCTALWTAASYALAALSQPLPR